MSFRRSSSMGPLYSSNMSRFLTLTSLAAVLLLMLAGMPGSAVAQTDVEELGRRFGATPPPQYFEILRSNPNAFQFSPDNGWVRRGRRVAAARNRLRGGIGDGVFRTEAAHSVDGVMTGDVYMPVFLVLFSNTDSAEIVANVPRESLQTRLYGLEPAPPYSVHTYYKEVSNDSVNVYGTVFDWAFVPGTDATYEGTNNGLSGVGPLMRDAANTTANWDSTVPGSLVGGDITTSLHEISLNLNGGTRTQVAPPRGVEVLGRDTWAAHRTAFPGSVAQRQVSVRSASEIHCWMGIDRCACSVAQTAGDVSVGAGAGQTRY